MIHNEENGKGLMMVVNNLPYLIYISKLGAFFQSVILGFIVFSMLACAIFVVFCEIKNKMPDKISDFATEKLDTSVDGIERNKFKVTVAIICVLFVWGLFLNIFILNFMFLIQREPEIEINARGLKFHNLGFIDWKDIDSIELARKLHQRKGAGFLHNVMQIILKKSSQWQPKLSPYFSATSFLKDKKIIQVKDVLSLDRYEIFDLLKSINPPIRLLNNQYF